MLIEPPTSLIRLLSFRIRDRFTACDGAKFLAPILFPDPMEADLATSPVASFLANRFPAIVSVYPNDRYLFCEPVINIRVDNRVSSALPKHASIPNLEFFAMVIVIHGLAHGLSNTTLDNPLETAFFGGIMGMVFKSGTAQDPQLPDIAYFMIRSPNGKVYKIDLEEAAAWITTTEGRISPFDFSRLEEIDTDGQDFLKHTCAFVNTAYAPVNIQPRLRRHAPYRLGDHIVFPQIHNVDPSRRV
ncbi:hypothetical protein EDD18DRAFT_1359794 [Armillaria luteobubalina]|uniref:Uncharacterized protein n=1 Tax=Armillaria luteobubalina TaxID=153913 RepID=A0AA39PPJ8_9AGAR|nr:hypothetical protein EDD18DRAFT_1359794 [Armillaria luteobubalina]